MIQSKTFAADSGDVADFLTLGASPSTYPDGDYALRVFGVTNDVSSLATIEAALVLADGGTTKVIGRFRGVLDTSAGKYAAEDGSAGDRVADVVWSEGDVDSVGSASLLSLVGSFNAKAQGAVATWRLGLIDIGGFTSVTLYALPVRRGGA